MGALLANVAATVPGKGTASELISRLIRECVNRIKLDKKGLLHRKGFFQVPHVAT